MAVMSDAPTHSGAVLASSWAMVDPFGDGSTSRAGAGAARTVAGHKLIRPGEAADRPTARTASNSGCSLNRLCGQP